MARTLADLQTDNVAFEIKMILGPKTVERFTGCPFPLEDADADEQIPEQHGKLYFVQVHTDVNAEEEQDFMEWFAELISGKNAEEGGTTRPEHKDVLVFPAKLSKFQRASWHKLAEKTRKLTSESEGMGDERFLKVSGKDGKDDKERKDWRIRKAKSIWNWCQEEGGPYLNYSQGEILQCLSRNTTMPPDLARLCSKRNMAKLLFQAIQNGREDRALELISKDRSLTWIKDDCNGGYPLHHAAWHGLERVVTDIIQQKTTLEQKDKKRQSPLTIARLNKKDRIVQLLIDAGAKDEGKDTKSSEADGQDEDDKKQSHAPAHTDSPPQDSESAVKKAGESKSDNHDQKPLQTKEASAEALPSKIQSDAAPQSEALGDTGPGPDTSEDILELLNVTHPTATLPAVKLPLSDTSTTGKAGDNAPEHEGQPRSQDTVPTLHLRPKTDDSEEVPAILTARTLVVSSSETSTPQVTQRSEGKPTNADQVTSEGVAKQTPEVGVDLSGKKVTKADGSSPDLPRKESPAAPAKPASEDAKEPVSEGGTQQAEKTANGNAKSESTDKAAEVTAAKLEPRPISSQKAGLAGISSPIRASPEPEQNATGATTAPEKLVAVAESIVTTVITSRVQTKGAEAPVKDQSSATKQPPSDQDKLSNTSRPEEVATVLTEGSFQVAEIDVAGSTDSSASTAAHYEPHKTRFEPQRSDGHAEGIHKSLAEIQVLASQLQTLSAEQRQLVSSVTDGLPALVLKMAEIQECLARVTADVIHEGTKTLEQLNDERTGNSHSRAAEEESQTKDQLESK